MRRWGRQDSPPSRPGCHLWTGAPVGALGRNGTRPLPRTWTGAPVEALWGVTALAHCRQMQSRSLAGPVCIWTGLLTCSQDIRSVVRLTSPVSVGPRRGVAHPVSLGKPSRGGLPDGSRGKICTMSLRNVVRSTLLWRIGFGQEPGRAELAFGRFNV